MLFSKFNTSYNIFFHCSIFFFQETPWSSAVEQDIVPLLQLEVSSEWFHLAPRDIHFVGRRKLLVMDSRSLNKPTLKTAIPYNGYPHYDAYPSLRRFSRRLPFTTALLTAATLITASFITTMVSSCSLALHL